MSAVLVTGAAGLVGRGVIRALAEDRRGLTTVVATDVRETPEHQRLPGVVYARLDITADDPGTLFAAHGIDTVVHLAAIVTPTADTTRERQHQVDVLGTRRVLDACVAHGVRRFVYTSSGAAYGYHPDAPDLLDESAPLRGNEVFAYAWHKRLVEQDLARTRAEHPELEQVVFRVSTVLGESVENQITALFQARVVVGLRGVGTPFCFIWDDDVAACLVAAVHGAPAGTWNLTGDGVMTLREIAAGLGRPFLALPEPTVQAGLRALKRLGVASYGPEQTLFLAHRPVLANRRLKQDFGYRPRMTSRQAFARYAACRGD